MNRAIVYGVGILFLLGLSGCSTRYKVVTESGNTYIADEKVHEESSDEYVRFKTTSGKSIRLKKSEVKSIEEQ